MSIVKKPLTTKSTKEHKGKKFNPLTFVYSPALACGESVVPFVFKILFAMEAV